MLCIELKEQKKFAVGLVCVLGFFIFGVAKNSDQINGPEFMAKHNVTVVHLGIASE